MAPVYRNNIHIKRYHFWPGTIRSRRTGKLLVAALVSATIAACTPATGPDTREAAGPSGQEPARASTQLPELTMVYQSGQCGDMTPGIHQLENQAALNRVTSPGATLGLDGQRRSGPQADFDAYRVLLISEGQRSTGGYSIRLNDDGVRLARGTVILPVDFIHPEAGALVTQAITSPCLVLGLSRGEGGEWSQVQAGPYSLNLD